VPLKLIADIAKFRAKETAERVKAKAAMKTKKAKKKRQPAPCTEL
jgi:hypothetical protein